MDNQENISKRSIFTVKQFCERNPAFTAGGIRHLILHSGKNGFAESFKRIGRRIYVDEQVFFECVDNVN